MSLPSALHPLARNQIGLAIGSRRLWAAFPDGAEWACSLCAGLLCWDEGSLSDALIKGLGQAHRGRAGLVVALLPPVVVARRLSLPPLPSRERDALLARDATHYIAGLEEPVVVGSRVLRRVSGRPDEILAYFAAGPVLEAIDAAVQRTAFTVMRMAAAQDLWLPASRHRRQNAPGVVIAQVDRQLLCLAPGDDVDPPVRRVPAALLGGAVSTFSHMLRARPEASLTVFGPENLRDTIVGALPSDTRTAYLGEPEPFAARTALRERPHELVSCEMRRHREKLRRRRSMWCVLVGLALCAGAIGLRDMRMRAALNALHSARAEERSAVDSALALELRVRALERQARTIAYISGRNGPWLPLVEALAVALPPGSSLSALRATVDSLVLEGEATNASEVMAVLGRADRLTHVRSEQPVRPEVRDSQLIERFVVSATPVRELDSPLGGLP